MKTLVYQGIEGAFSHLAAKRHFGGFQLKGLPSFREAFEAVSQGEADFALLPIENSLVGTIYETLDLLNGGDLKIVGSVHERIEHCLLGCHGSTLAGIEKVISHPKALEQCTRFLEKFEAVPYSNTAAAAAEVAKENDLRWGAIANRAAAEIHGLSILAEKIEDHPENYTRFLLLSRNEAKGKKCSLCFTLDHQPGSLANVLMFFAERKINLTFIVSRPLIGRPFEYMFYVDLDGAPPIEELRKRTNSLKFLGAYDVI